jgi:AraC-like DNA-binding protein
MSTLIRSASLTNFAEIAKQCGLDPMALLRAENLSQKSLTEPDLKIEAHAVVRLIERAAQLAHEPAFGLRMGESRRLSNLGPLGMLLRDEPTLRDVLNALVRHIRMHNEALIVAMDEVDDTVVIKFELAVDHKMPIRQSVELAMAVAYRTISFFLGPAWKPRQVCFSHGAPAQRNMHKHVFGDAISFNQEFDGLLCNLSDLNQPNPSADPVMARYAHEFFQSKSVVSQNFTSNVQQLILLLLPLGQCNAELIAQHLGCNRRTITRRLELENTGFHVLVNEHRRRMVQQLLQEKSRTLAQMSSLLGFSSPSSFSRWYKSQFGTLAKDAFLEKSWI